MCSSEREKTNGMRLASRIALVFAMALATSALMAQDQHESGERALDFAVTYNAQRGTTTGGNSFWLQGGTVELAGTFYRGLGIAANLSGEKSSSIGSAPAGSAPVGLEIVTTTFGPRYTWALPARSRAHNLHFFGQGLIGWAHGMESIFPTPYGAQNNVYSFAVQAGGGADLALTHRVSLRLVQAEWLRTQFPNGASNVENSFRIGAGIALHFPD
jgi:hypothetical protein